MQLLKELQTRKLARDSSPMLLSEQNAEWKVLLVLCPSRLRNKYRQDWLDKSLSDYDVALALRIPELFVPNIMSDYYDEVVRSLVTPVAVPNASGGQAAAS